MLIDKKKLKKSFDVHASRYDENTFIQRQILKKLLDYIGNVKDISCEKKIKLLELGCGTAEFSNILSKKIKFDEIHLVDISVSMLNIAKRKVQHNNLSQQVIDFDYFNNFSSYDFIISNMALHWSSSFEKLFKKITFYMKPGSFFIFSIPNSNSFDFFRQNKLDNLINSFPRHEVILKKLDKNFNCNFSEEIFYEKFDSPLDFLKKLKNIGAGISNNSINLTNLFRLRKLKNKETMNYNISFYKIRKKNE